MINTYNESSLHATLKKIYALESDGTMEVKLDDTEWICDILDADGNAIEIQTANLSALTEKSEYLLENGRKIKIVHPIASIKWIETYDSSGNLISRKKSPKKASIFDSLRGMTQICPLFLNENCSLEVLSCEISEMRRKTAQACLTQNMSRRRLKNWLPMGKRLEKINEKKIFNTASDWLSLLPPRMAEYKNKEGTQAFRITDLTKEMKDIYGAKTARWANLLVWIFLKMGILEECEKKGRSRFFREKAPAS